jgi:Per os infectivity factor 3
MIVGGAGLIAFTASAILPQTVHVPGPVKLNALPSNKRASLYPHTPDFYRQYLAPDCSEKSRKCMTSRDCMYCDLSGNLYDCSGKGICEGRHHSVEAVACGCRPDLGCMLMVGAHRGGIAIEEKVHANPLVSNKDDKLNPITFRNGHIDPKYDYRLHTNGKVLLCNEGYTRVHRESSVGTTVPACISSSDPILALFKDHYIRFESLNKNMY